MFANSYVKEVYASEHVFTATKLLHVILYAKYGKTDLYKVMENQCQNLKMTQCNELIKLLQKFVELFNGTLGTWKIDPVDFELKEDAEPICSRPYPVPKVHREMFKRRLSIWYY